MQAERKVKSLNLVEAAGVEPASEKTSSKEHSCFSQIQFVSYQALGMGKETHGTFSIDLIRGVLAERVGPACCATFATRPQAKRVANGYLVN